MTQPGRKRRSDFGVKRPGLMAERQARSLLQRQKQRDEELRRLARLSEKRLSLLVAAINDGKHNGDECVEPGTTGHVWYVELVAVEAARRGWPALIPAIGQGGVSPP